MIVNNRQGNPGDQRNTNLRFRGFFYYGNQMMQRYQEIGWEEYILRFFHLSDLHIGKQLYGYSLLEDQEWILDKILQKVKERKPDGVLLCGDIYDKSVPSGEAVTVFDRFLCRLTEISPKMPVLMISGNHDSPERLSFAGTILERQKVFVEGLPPVKEEEHIKKVILEDGWGPVEFWLLPFVKPGYVKEVFGGKEPESYQEAVQGLLEREMLLEKPDKKVRKVLLTHQFFTASGEKPKQSESETIIVGGLDQVDIGCLKDFDYVAMGHIHRPQSMGKPWIYYCGTPLQYSVSEWNQRKYLTEIELREPGSEPKIVLHELQPLREVRVLRGTLEEILEATGGVISEDYVSVTLTDEQEPYQPRERLETLFPRLLEVKMDNGRMNMLLQEEETEDTVTDPREVFQRFFSRMQGREMEKEEEEIMEQVFQKVGEEEI